MILKIYAVEYNKNNRDENPIIKIFYIKNLIL